MSGLSIGYSASTLSKRIANSYASAVVTIKNSNGKANSGTLKTGDTVTIKVGNDSKTYTIVIYGDASGDGKVTAVDYVKIKNYIMGKTSLNNSYKEAANVNKDSKVNAVDYVKIKNYIMGKTSITQ